MPSETEARPRKKIITVFGTRPEVIKLAPVLKEMAKAAHFQSIAVNSGQHLDLLDPFVRLFGVQVQHDLKIMSPGQNPNQICSRILAALDPILAGERPDLLLVQGDTTTALAGALAAFNQRIPVGHVEAGLRSGNTLNPYPEEMNRRLVTRLATYHFAATAQNRDTLLAEGVAADHIYVTGNPVVDSLNDIVTQPASQNLHDLLGRTTGLKRLVLTTHRRESFGRVLEGNLSVLRDFVQEHQDVVLIFPVHPNPSVRATAANILAGRERVLLLPPLDYVDFIGLLAQAWLIVSDSGGIQEEAPTLRKPVLVLRENTERPEALVAGVSRLVGSDPSRLRALLESAYADDSWARNLQKIPNPFGQGDSGRRIIQAIDHVFWGVPIPHKEAAQIADCRLQIAD